jgi:histidine triad (HIT) family protein
MTKEVFAMSDCIFCKIIGGEIPSTKVYEDDKCLAFRDLDPKAPTHILVIPKEHIQSVDAVTLENSGVVAHIFTVIPGIMRELGITGGYRVITNIGADAGQTVPHLHFHVLGGKEMGWSPAG